MPYANNKGIRIHYEIEGKGSPLVLQYGQYFPLDVWVELNYVSALQNDYQLILVDARGQGASDKPYDPEAYRIEHRVQDILAVLDDLGLEKAHYMGYSSGAYLGFGLAKYAIDRVHSLILGGSYPYADPNSDSDFDLNQIEALGKQTTAEFVEGLEKFVLSLHFPPFSPRLKAGMLRHDPRALIAWHRSNIEMTGFDEIVNSISVPCLIYAGEKSYEYTLAQKAAREIPGALFVGIPDGVHLEGGTWINSLRPHINHLLKSA